MSKVKTNVSTLRRFTSQTIYCLFALLLFACSEDESVVEHFKLSSNELTVAADGGMESINVSSTVHWVASTDPNQTWLRVSPATGYGDQNCVIKIDSTLINDVRSTEIRFIADGMQPQTLTVTQVGYGNIIHSDSTEIHVKASMRTKDERFFNLNVVANVDFKVNITYNDGDREWLTYNDTEITLDRGSRPRTTKLRFDWNSNPVQEKRTATIELMPKDESKTLEKPAVIVVTQDAARRIEDNREGDSLAVIAIAEELQLYSGWDTNENMKNWGNVRLWERNDKDLPCREAIGRVRDVQFFLADIAEQLPAEVKYLKYVESLSFFSNTNSFLKDFELGTEVCGLKHLKSLEVFAYGLVDLPEELTQLGETLEELKIGGNNFTSIPAILTKENFPKLKVLEMQACRRWTTSDLRNANSNYFEGGLGLHFDTNENNALRNLLLWDTLEELVLSYNYIEGQIPDFKPGEDGVVAWSQSDVNEWGGDTIQYVADRQIPKIMPKAKHLNLNLNFFTGKLPDWLLYHPRLLEWTPDILIFNQMESGINKHGEAARFSNEPSNFEYYFEAFPKYRSKYEIKEEWDENEI